MNNYMLTVCLNPTWQNTIYLNKLREGQINRSGEHYLSVSGKGVNCSRVLVQLGHKTVHLTHAGGNTAKEYVRLCKKEKIDIYAAKSPGSEIRHCHTLINSGKKTNTEIIEEAGPVALKTEDNIRKLYRKLLGGAKIIIISGSKAAGYSPELFPWMVKTAKSGKVPVILDYRGEDLLNSLPYGPDIIKPNFEELSSIFKLSAAINEKEIGENLISIAEDYKTTPIISSGAGAVRYVCDGKAYGFIPEKIDAINAIGSGDAMAAGIAAAYLEGKNIHQIVAEGARCGTLNAQTKLPGSICKGEHICA